MEAVGEQTSGSDPKFVELLVDRHQVGIVSAQSSEVIRSWDHPESQWVPVGLGFWAQWFGGQDLNERFDAVPTAGSSVAPVGRQLAHSVVLPDIGWVVVPV